MRRSPFRRRRNKYGAVKTTVDGITFDSKLEAGWYEALKLLQAAEQIQHLELQKEFPLLVGSVSIGVYIADFYFYEPKIQKWVVGDAKGVATDVWKLKWKIMKAAYPEYDYQVFKKKPYVRAGR